MNRHDASDDCSDNGKASFLEQIAENIHEVIWLFDRNANAVCYVNPAYERIVGRPVDALYTNPEAWHDSIHPDDRELVNARRPFGESGSLEFRIVRPDGEVRWLWSHGRFIRNDQDRIVGTVGVVEDITERKRTENALQSSLSLLRATLDSTADGILVVDIEGRVSGFNHRFLELWRIPDFLVMRGDDDELLRHVGDQLVDPRGFLVKVKQLYADPEASSFDVLAFRDGRVFERYSRPQMLGDQAVGRVWSFRDVTARVKAEERLRQRNHRLDIHNQVLLRLAQRRIQHAADLAEVLPEITEAASDMMGTERVSIWEFDEAHTRLGLTELYERSKRLHSRGIRLERNSYPAYFQALELERSIAANNAREDPRTRDFTDSYLVPFGITSMLDAPIRAGGQLLGVVCFEHVGTQRNWTVEDRTFAGSVADLVSLSIESAHLQRVEDGVHLLLEASRVLAASLDYRTTLANVARLAVPTLADWCLVSVYEDGRLQRLAVAHVDPSKKELLKELERRYPNAPTSPAARVMRTGEAELVPEITEELLQERTVDEGHRDLIRAAGVRSYMAIPLKGNDAILGVITFASATRSFDSQDFALAKNIASSAAVAIDNARLHEGAHAASKAKSNFLAVMSHELRTPLSAITGYADLLEAGIPDPLTPKQREQVGRIKLRAYDLLRIIEEILAFSRMETGDERFHFVDVNVSELLDDIARVARPMAEEHGLQLYTRAPEPPAFVRTDPNKARQILVDLISNAVKFTEEGHIDLAAHLSNGSINFVVSDTGIGISPEYYEKIFEPFFQVEDALTREKGGTGIGLAVARKLARHLGGDIKVESIPREGSTFTVTIPSHPQETTTQP